MTSATIEFVNAPDNAAELDDLRSRAQRGRPFGSAGLGNYRETTRA
jgi:hypothetical protein